MIGRAGRTLAAGAVVFLALACAIAGRAADPEPSSSPAPLPTTPAAVTHHQIVLGGRTLLYTATAGRLLLHDAQGEPTASIFSVAYALDGASPARRPLAFVWNGGPGVSTMWLHLLAFGPQRVETNDRGTIVPPAPLVANEATLLASTDLVFVDAPGTGFSRIGGHGTRDDFYGVDQDARAFTAYIQDWLTANGRWGSPIFLIGESYGTPRAANVVNRLQQAGVGVNGVVLISSFLDMTDSDPALPNDDRSEVAYLPSEAAVAWYHNALPGSRPPQLEPFVQQVRDYAAGPYATALLRGDRLDAAGRRAVIDALHRYTGLDPAYIDRANLRIDPSRFEQELERETGKVLGRLDARFEGDELDRNADSPSYDPTTDDAVTDAVVSALNRYVRGDLHFRDDSRYVPQNDAESSWKWQRDNASLSGWVPNVLPDLAAALTRNPALRVLSANGYYDLATPFFGTELQLEHLGLPPALQSHIRLTYYASGHMIYLNPAARLKLRDDIAAFIGEATK